MADYLNIAGRIRTTASDGVAMEAQEVKDLNLNKTQQEVNADVQTELGDRYTKEETYSKEQLDDLITTPDVNRVYVIATNLTTAVTDLLPETGSSNTLYNVGNWNGTQYDTTVYSIYGWDGTAYVCLAVRSFVGEVYDISANHPDGQGNPTPYADLAAALGTDGANVPAGIRRGGMSVKFIQGTVQSSDNKYVQFRYMGTEVIGTPNPFLDTTNWQGVVNVPEHNSKNLVDGDGVVRFVTDSYQKIGVIAPAFSKKGRMKRTSGVVTDISNTDVISNFYDVSKYQGKTIYLSPDAGPSGFAVYSFVKSDLWANNTAVDFATGESGTHDFGSNTVKVTEITVPSDAVYLIANYQYVYQSIIYVIPLYLYPEKSKMLSMYQSENKNEEDIIKEGFAKKANLCLYDKSINSQGNVVDNTGLFVTPLIPIDTTTITVKNGSNSNLFFAFYPENLSSPLVYTVNANQERPIYNIDLTTYKYVRATFGMVESECYIMDGNKNYLWYGYYSYYTDSISEAIIRSQTTPVFVLTGGSFVSFNRNTNVVTFPQNSAIIYKNTRYAFSSAVTLTLTNNNGLVIFNPDNLATDNGLKQVNHNYQLSGKDGVLCTYSTLYSKYLSLPQSMVVHNDVMIKDYSDSMVLFKNKLQAAIKPGLAEGSTTPLQLLWFSDLHKDVDVVSRIQQWISVNSLSSLFSNVISTGDQVQQYFNPSFDWWHDAGCDNYLQVIGNHEAREQTTNADTHTAQECYEKFFAPYISNWGVQSAGVNLCYYYKDYATNKIRMIVLDCMHWDSAQNTWLATTLADAKTAGLNVFVVNHFRADTPDYIQNPFTSLSTGNGSTLNSQACATVQDFIDGGGNFICHLAGHTHYDVVYTCHNYPNQLGVIIGCATRFGADDEHPQRDGRFYCLFNMISFDVDRKLVKVLRPSCNMDRWCRAQNTLVVNYETRQIVYND